MLAIAARGPAENARRITNDGIRVIGIQPQSQTLVLCFLFLICVFSTAGLTPLKSAFGVTICPEMITVHGKLLTAPKVEYDATNGITKTPSHAEWNLIGSKFHMRTPMPIWSFLRLGNARLSDTTIWQFREALRSCGMDSPVPVRGLHAPLPGSGDDENNDQAIQKAMAQAADDGIPILLVILETPSAAVYARVKYWGDTTCGRHLISADTFHKTR